MSRAKCRCGAVVRFATDRLGRTVEQCDGCGYEGPLRVVAEPLPVTLPRKRARRRTFDPARFRCGHDRSPDNSAWNKRGWFECRECARARKQRNKRRAAA